MKRFLRNVLIFFLSVGLFAAAVNAAYLAAEKRNNNGTMGSVRDYNDYIRDVPDAIRICNFGSSHGYFSFDYSRFSDQVCFNFGLVSQYPSYDYRILQQFREHIDRNATVFITLSHFSFFGRDETTETDFAAKNRRYYRFLSDDLIKNYDAKTDFYVNHFPALLEDDPISLARTLLGLAYKDVWNSGTTSELAAIQGPETCDHYVLSRLDENGQPVLLQNELSAIRGMVALCREIGADPVFITTPYLREYSDAIRQNAPQFFDDFYGVIGQLCEELDVPYYDYSMDERFSGDYSLFINTDHLNRKGAERFTAILLDDVLNIKPAADENFQ